MFKRNLSKAILSLLTRISKGSKTAAKRLIRTLTRSLMVMTRRNKLPMAGFMLAFVLPTVTMVMLVVVLLTLAITLRSFDRAQNARNVKVNQQVLAAATPALERAKAKISYLLDPKNRSENKLPTGTPPDIEIKRVLSKPKPTVEDPTPADTYTFGDEVRLRIGYKLNRASLPTASWDKNNQELVENNEAINTVWRFPVDTDNNGRYDSYTIYGIYFRSPPRDGDNGATAGQFLVERKPLETRTPPMPGTLGNPQCAAALGTSASLVGDSGWYQSDGKLKKSFYVYTVTVPITAQPTSANGTIPVGQFETFKGTRGFSALEYQQDRVRVPLLNNAVVYEDDLEISPGPAFRINGGMLTNSNLLVTSTNKNSVDLYLISGEKSCYYKQENSKIFVGGNVVNGWAGGNPSGTSTIHLFQPAGSPTLPLLNTLTTANQSVSNPATEVLYNNNAYAKRLDALVGEQIAKDATTDPISVQRSVAAGNDPDKDRKNALQTYFAALTRKVPFAEVPLDLPETIPGTVTEGSVDTLRPIEKWSLPTDANTKLTTLPTNLKAQDPNPNGGTKPSKEDLLGDRIIAGNNLPLQWWNGRELGTTEQTVAGGFWSNEDGTPTSTPRTRTTQKQTLAAVGISDRGDYWEKAAAQKPENPLSSIGGLRVITGAGVYERTNSFLPPPSWFDPTANTTKTGPASASVTKTAANTYDDPATTAIEQYEVVWPDSMPMSPVLGSQLVYNNGANDTVAPAEEWATLAQLPPADTGSIDPGTRKYAKGDLRMRATAVYHYATHPYDPIKKSQAPIACISSYYDPSTASTARNLSTLGDSTTDVSGELLPTPSGIRDANIGSNNGIVYGAPIYTISDTKFEAQANMVFPDGRFVNEQLRTALMKAPAARNLADQAAIDSTACAFGILGTSGFTLGTKPDIDHGAIKEVALLNAREIKAVDKDNTITTKVDETFTLSSPTGAGAAQLTGKYDLALEERMPLEIRVTQIDLNLLRKKAITQTNDKGPKPEYLLPNSGIIYASRDDAAPDRSDQSSIISPTDSLLDPTRRPHGIMLINGRYLARNDQNDDGQNDTAPTDISDVVKEKGLTLVSNLPVYVQGDLKPAATVKSAFNLHSQQEFNTALTQPDWGNFYSRALPLNKNFACRPGDPRLPDCTIGDTWRAATVLADAVTVLSRNFRPGFRNEGDFDLRNNAGAAVTGYDAIRDNPPVVPPVHDGIKDTDKVKEADYNIDLNGNGVIDPDTNLIAETEITAKAARLLNGFYNNNFVTNGLSSGTFDVNGVVAASGTLLDSNYATTTGTVPNSSYFNNFVTPVQRRGDYPEYVMEMCLKLPVSACGPGDWVVDAGDPTTTPPTPPKKASDPTVIGQSRSVVDSGSGTTAIPPAIKYQRFPRRVAFKRDGQNRLVDASNTPINAGNPPVPIGVNDPTPTVLNSGDEIVALSNGTVPTSRPPNTLRFKTTTSPTVPSTVATYTPTDGLFYQNAPTETMQPLLVPVLQIHVTKTGDPGSSNLTDINTTRWLSQAEDTTFNLVVAAGDIPSRPNGDSNGGVQNLTRFLENWNPGGPGGNIPSTKNTNILGSFIQLTRSAYATAPYTAVLKNAPPTSLFGNDYPKTYKIQNAGGTVPTFVAPNRLWGYDVGLLSQSPDLFTQLFTTPTTETESDEFFREVSRDDIWVKTLLCAKRDDDLTVNAVDDDQRPTSFCNDTTKIPNPLPTP